MWKVATGRSCRHDPVRKIRRQREIGSGSVWLHLFSGGGDVMHSMRTYLSEIVGVGRRRFLLTPSFGNREEVEVDMTFGALSERTWDFQVS